MEQQLHLRFCLVLLLFNKKQLDHNQLSTISADAKPPSALLSLIYGQIFFSSSPIITLKLLSVFTSLHIYPCWGGRGGFGLCVELRRTLEMYQFDIAFAHHHHYLLFDWLSYSDLIPTADTTKMFKNNNTGASKEACPFNHDCPSFRLEPYI